jgi:hypothetical protein
MPFHGLSNHPSTFTHAPQNIRAEVEAQKADARERRVVWDAERVTRMDSADLDADGEPDPDYPEQNVGANAMLGPWTPHGLRRDDGEIVPMSEEGRRKLDAMDVDEGGATSATLEIVYGGHMEDASQCLNERVSSFICAALLARC